MNTTHTYEFLFHVIIFYLVYLPWRPLATRLRALTSSKAGPGRALFLNVGTRRASLHPTASTGESVTGLTARDSYLSLLPPLQGAPPIRCLFDIYKVIMIQCVGANCSP